ncbi:MAG: STAS domain-containing protein [Actinomycetota bacterium]
MEGVIDEAAASHLESALINLGSRRLVLDLTRVTSLDRAGAAGLLRLVQRAGTKRVSVVVEPQHAEDLGIDDAGAFPASA